VIGTTQKAQSPAATGLSAYENTSSDILGQKRETTLIARFAMKGAIPKTDSVDFTALRSAYAQQGHHLHSVTSKDGATTYWAERWGLVRYLPSLHDAALFLAQIGGRL